MGGICSNQASIGSASGYQTQTQRGGHDNADSATSHPPLYTNPNPPPSSIPPSTHQPPTNVTEQSKHNGIAQSSISADNDNDNVAASQNDTKLLGQLPSVIIAATITTTTPSITTIATATATLINATSALWFPIDVGAELSQNPIVCYVDMIGLFISSFISDSVSFSCPYHTSYLISILCIWIVEWCVGWLG
jgi:hypothetical protein